MIIECDIHCTWTQDPLRSTPVGSSWPPWTSAGGPCSRLPATPQVMGAPVAGSNVRASVLTGGGLRMKGLQPRLRSRRVQMIFPLSGSERRGLVSLEAKKLKVCATPPRESRGLCA